MNTPAGAPDQGGRPFAEHALAYVELATALLQARQKAMQRRLAVMALAIASIAVALLLVTAGIVAAAWDTPHRWLVLLLVAGVYLLCGIGCIMALHRRPEAPPPLELLVAELRKDAQLFASIWRGSP